MTVRTTLQLHTRGLAGTRTASIPQIQHKTVLYWQCPGNYGDSGCGWRGGGAPFNRPPRRSADRDGRQECWRTFYCLEGSLIKDWTQHTALCSFTASEQKAHRQQHFRPAHNTCLVSPLLWGRDSVRGCKEGTPPTCATQGVKRRLPGLWKGDLKVRPHRTRSAAADCGLCPLRNVTF